MLDAYRRQRHITSPPIAGEPTPEDTSRPRQTSASPRHRRNLQHMSTVVRTSRRVASVLRHDADVARTPDGWVKVTELLHRLGITRDELTAVLDASTRYELDPHGQRIRAKYGHSLPTGTGQPSVPPATLYHGTKWANLTPILRDGLSPMSRQQVHLHVDPAVVVRRGAAVLAIAAQEAHEQGHHFYDVGSGVWLTSAVPAVYISRAN